MIRRQLINRRIEINHLEYELFYQLATYKKVNFLNLILLNLF